MSILLAFLQSLKETLAEHIDAITTYPDRDYTSLRNCMAEYAGTEPDNIIVGNGSTELISLFIQLEQSEKGAGHRSHLFGI